MKTWRKWTKEEDNMVMRQDIPDKVLSEQIQRSPDAIGSRRRILRKGKQINRVWSPEENALILNCELSISEIAKRLNCTRKTVDVRRYYLKHREKKVKHWTEKENQLFATDLSIAGLALALDCTEEEILRHKRYLQEFHKERNKQFSLVESELIMQELIPDTKLAELIGKSMIQIHYHRVKMIKSKRRRWSDEIDRMILDQEYPDSELVERIGCNYFELEQHRQYLTEQNAIRERSYKPYSQEEDALILSGIPDHELVLKIRRSPLSIINRRIALNKMAKGGK